VGLALSEGNQGAGGNIVEDSCQILHLGEDEVEDGGTRKGMVW
jgi:hypothetical protein